MTESNGQIQRASLLRQFAAFIGWLSGALVGVGALLSAFGYFAVHANARFLGFDPILVDYSSANYLMRGAEAWTHIALSAAAMVITLSLLVVLRPAAAFLITVLALRMAPNPERGLGRIARKYWDFWKLVFYVGLLAYLYFVFYDPYAMQFGAALDISDVLYDATPAAGPAVRHEIVCGQGSDTAAAFNRATIAGGVAIALLVLAARVTATMTSFRWLIAPFVVVAVLFVYFLASLYGVLVMERKFSPVELQTEEQSESGLFLVLETDSRFVLWRPAERTIISVAEKNVRRLTLNQRRDLRDVHPGLAEVCRGDLVQRSRP